MNSYFSKIALRSGETKQGGQQTSFRSPAVPSADDFTGSIKKGPEATAHHAFGTPEISPAMPQGQSSNKLSQIVNSAVNGTFTPEEAYQQTLDESKASSYFKNLVTRSNQTETIYENIYHNKIPNTGDTTNINPDNGAFLTSEFELPLNKNAADRKAVPAIQHIELSENKNEENNKNAAGLPVESIQKEKPGGQKDRSESGDFVIENQGRKYLNKETITAAEPKQPLRLKSEPNEVLPSFKTSEKNNAAAFNPVENKVAAQQTGTKNSGQKLVIGKITVEVVSAPAEPVKVQQSVNRRTPKPASNNIAPVHKLSFGLGQL